MRVRDNITRAGARASGVKRYVSLERWCCTERLAPTLNGGSYAATESTKGGSKLCVLSAREGAA
jgi:hypothetical protein